MNDKKIRKLLTRNVKYKGDINKIKGAAPEAPAQTARPKRKPFLLAAIASVLVVVITLSVVLVPLARKPKQSADTSTGIEGVSAQSGGQPTHTEGSATYPQTSANAGDVEYSPTSADAGDVDYPQTSANAGDGQPEHSDSAVGGGEASYPQQSADAGDVDYPLTSADAGDVDYPPTPVERGDDTACEEAASSKTAENNKINEYISELSENDYSASDWEEILETGKQGELNIVMAKEEEKELIACMTIASIESVMPEKVDKIKNGAFFISDNSWELYIRNYAEKTGKDEKWIINALTNDVETDVSQAFYNRKRFWVAVVDNKITISDGQYNSFELTENNGIYSGSFLSTDVVLWMKNDKLFLTKGDEFTCFEYDASYIVDCESRITEAPANIDVEIEKDDVIFQWNYRSEYGIFGALVELKTGDEDYKTYKTENVYMNMFTVQIDKNYYNENGVYVRISHLGGPVIQTDKKIVLFDNSEYVTFLIKSGDPVNVERSGSAEE